MLHIATDPEELAREEGLPLPNMLALLEEIRRDLFIARERRVRPGRDEKILCSWNGLMMRSLAEAGLALGRSDYVEAAIHCAEFIDDNLMGNGGLLHTWKDGKAKIGGFLEDYAMLAEGLLYLHQATLERCRLERASSLVEVMADRFWDTVRETFFDVSLDQPAFLVRPRGVFDGATPSSSSTATFDSLRLSRLTGEAKYEIIANTSLRSQAAEMGHHPLGFGYWLSALDFYLSPVKEIAIVGPPQDPRTRELVRVVFERYLPNRVLVGADPAETRLPETVALLQGRSMVDGLPTAYVCERFTCLSPVNDPGALRVQLFGTP